MNVIANVNNSYVKKPLSGRFAKVLRRQWPLYLMVIPGVIFYIIFKYIPLFGSIIAFEDYKVSKGIFGSPWVGLDNFKAFFAYQELTRVFVNTVIVSTYSLILTFPMPIVFALLLNEINNRYFKRSIQTLSYLPHFISWVIIGGLTFDILSSTGMVNSIRNLMGLENILFMQQEKYFRGIVIITGIWKEMGWGSIIILAAISNINIEYYEAAIVDGAGRWKQTILITLPLLLPTIVIIFLLSVGHFLELGFDRIYNLLTPMTYSVGDVIDTYVYRAGIQQGRYSLTTAVGLFQSVIGFVLVYGCNKISRKVWDGGLW